MYIKLGEYKEPEKYTVTFDSKGGSSVDDITINAGETIDTLPTPIKENSTFSGWYIEETKVNAPYTPNSDITLYAKWDVDSFAVVFKEDGECIFNGQNQPVTGDNCTSADGVLAYINTGIELFNEENINKDFEVGFSITSRGNSESQGTMFSDMDESGSPWPGLVYRYDGRNINYDEIAANANNNISIENDYYNANIINVIFKKVDGILYVKINDEEFEELISLEEMLRTFNVAATFGASLDKNGNPQRHFVGTLSNMYIKLAE